MDDGVKGSLNENGDIPRLAFHVNSVTSFVANIMCNGYANFLYNH